MAIKAQMGAELPSPVDKGGNAPYKGGSYMIQGVMHVGRTARRGTI